MLTHRQQDVLAAVRTIGSDGWPVSVREVAQLLGLASSSTAFVHMSHLERQGLLERSPRGERGGWRAVEL